MKNTTRSLLSMAALLTASAVFHMVGPADWNGAASSVGYSFAYGRSSENDAVKPSPDNRPQVPPGHDDLLTSEDWERIRKTLSEIKAAGEKTESRSYENKMMAREMVWLMRAVAVIIIALATAVAVVIWLVGRRRSQRMVNSSSELAEALVLVEERQAKLADVLQELKEELDYLHNPPSPNLKNLILRAEDYLEQNHEALEKSRGPNPGSTSDSKE